MHLTFYQLTLSIHLQPHWHHSDRPVSCGLAFVTWLDISLEGSVAQENFKRNFSIVLLPLEILDLKNPFEPLWILKSLFWGTHNGKVKHKESHRITLPKCILFLPLWWGIKTGRRSVRLGSMRVSRRYATGSNGWNMLKTRLQVGSSKSTPIVSMPRTVMNIPEIPGK